MQKSAEAWYHKVCQVLTEDHLQLIKSYYNIWSYNSDIKLTFRFLKGFFFNTNSNKGEWHLIHKLVNKRRINNKDLSDMIKKCIIKGYYPIRIFHSVTEWLSPHEVFDAGNQSWLLRSGFVPLEDDRSLEKSIDTAFQIYSIEKLGKLVYSGNKSIHIWYPIQLEDYLSKENWPTTARRLINADRKIRRKLFKKISKKFPHLDDRISKDPWRVVPIIGSLNATTGRIVTEIPYETQNIDPDQLRENTKFTNWKDFTINQYAEET